MANFVKMRPGGWTDGVDSVTAADLNLNDTQMAKSINASDGSTHAPTSPIVIGGGAAGGLTMTVSGGATPNYPAFGSTVTIVRTFPVTPATRVYPGGALTSGSFAQGQAAGAILSRIIEVPDGCTLTNIRAYFIVNGAHVSLPASGPNLSVQRILPSNALLSTFLNAADPVAFTLPGTIAAYVAGGVVQHWDYACNVNNTIDRSLQYVLATLTDESGGGAIAGNTFLGFDATFTLAAFRVA